GPHRKTRRRSCRPPPLADLLVHVLRRAPNSLRGINHRHLPADRHAKEPVKQLRVVLPTPIRQTIRDTRTTPPTTLHLSLFADRTVALTRLRVRRIRMPIRALGARLAAPDEVLHPRHQFQVIDVAAPPIPAQMVNSQTVLDGSVDALPGVPVRV